MALTLSASVGTGDVILTFSGPPNSPFLKIDSEQMAVLTATQPVRNELVSGNSGQGYPSSGVTVQVTRAWNGTDRAPHNAGATITPLWEALTATAGTLV